MEKPLSPWISAGVLFLLAVLALVMGLPEITAAWLACIFFFAITLLHPLNGIYFILLAVPFFLGDSKRPFYPLIEFFAYTTIFSGIGHYFLRKKNFGFSKFLFPALAFGAVSLLSIPLNFKEIIWELMVWTRSETLAAIGSSHEGSHMYYFRTLFNYLSGIMLFLTAYVFTKDDKDILKILNPILVILSVNIVIAYLLGYGILPAGSRFLGLSLSGRAPYGGITGFAYNRGYLSQYLSTFYPLILYYVIKDKKNTATTAACVVLLLAVFSLMALTLQRISAVVIAGQVLLFVVLMLKISQNRKRDFLIVSVSLTLAVFIFWITDRMLLGGSGIERISSSVRGVLASSSSAYGPRIQLWRTARVMFLRNPVFGLGLGRFMLSFEEYSKLAGVSFWGVRFFRTTAHNLYLHILSEQGILGLGSFLTIIFTTYFYVFAHIKSLAREKQVLLTALSISLAGWLLYGLTQHTLYVRSIALFFWIALGFIGALLKDHLPAIRPGKKTAAVLLLSFLVLLAVRTAMVISHPYPENYYAGFHSAEMQPEGRPARWIGKKSVRKIPAQDGDLVLGLKCPTPAVSHRPQKVAVIVNGVEHRVILTNTDYKEILIPGESIHGKYVWILFKTSYTANPKKEGWSSDNRNLGVMVYEPLWREH